jgi:hypothetical protein
VLGLQGLAIDRYGVRADKAAAVADHLDAAPVHQVCEGIRDAADHRLFALDQPRPIEGWLIDGDVMRFGAFDLVESMTRCDEHFFRHAAAVRAGAAEQIRLDHCDAEARLSRGDGDTHPGVAPAEDHDVEVARGHCLNPLVKPTHPEWHRPHQRHYRYNGAALFFRQHPDAIPLGAWSGDAELRHSFEE